MKRLLFLLLPLLGAAAPLPADAPVTVLTVEKLEGTAMVTRPEGKGEVALEHGEPVERGAVVRTYGKSWVILKSPKGDRVGIDADTETAFDEIFQSGPDRQLRILLRGGRLHLQAKASKSRQSFFEVHAGNLVVSPWKMRGTLTYLPEEGLFEVRFFGGDKPKLKSVDRQGEVVVTVENSQSTTKVIDASGEVYFPFPSRRVWEGGSLVQEDPLPLEEGSETYFQDFFKGKARYFHLRGPGATPPEPKGAEREIRY